MGDSVIVSRHPAAIQFVAEYLHPGWHPPVTENGRLVWRPFNVEPEEDYILDEVPVFAEVSPEQVQGKIVYGNLPLHLAAVAKEVWAIEFVGSAPRGAEYNLEDMKKAGAKLVRYQVIGLNPGQEVPELHLSRNEAQEGGYCC